MNDDHKTIKRIIEDILEKMGIEASIGFTDTVFIIETNEAGILIGEGGKNLFSLSHILKKIINKFFESENREAPQFSLDVNGYYSKKINNLKEAAKMSAQRVIFFKKEITLDPMNAFERRIIHMVLSEYPDIKTESIGEETDRRIVIKPII